MKIAATAIPPKRMFTNNNNVKKTKLNLKLKKTNVKAGILRNARIFITLSLIAPIIKVSGAISIALESTIPTGNFSLSRVLFMNKVRSLYLDFLLKLNNSALISFNLSFSVLFK